tara:strand:- start:180 stop:1136 length:957 start_codon:yes stop_codon:yes gene_type:complete
MTNPFEFLNQDEIVTKIVVLFGDEPSLIFKIKKNIRSKLRGDFEKVKLNLSDLNFEGDFQAANLSNSLFSDKKIIEIVFDKNRTSKEILSRLQLIQANSTENLIILEVPNLTGKTFQKDFFPILSENSQIIHCAINDKKDIKNYLSNNLPKKFNTSDNIDFLSELYEGNFQNLQNDIEHTLLIQDDLDDLNELFFDNSIQNNFKLFELISKNNITGVLNLLRSMKRNDRNSAALVLWILARDCRALIELKNGNNNLKALRIWDNQLTFYQNVAKKLSYQSINKIISLLDSLDKSIKGVNNYDPWIIVEEIALKLSKRS